MTILTDYNQFGGRHWETGTIHNYFAYRGVTAPHTGQPISEALLMGVSGGIVFGYFTFEYEGWDPFVAILSRNTFDPWDTMLSRMGVVQNIERTGADKKGHQNLLNTLDDGVPAIALADFFSLDYNLPPADKEGMWGMMELLVYGLDETTAYIADRANVGLTVSAENLHAARARIKKDKFQLTTLEAPDFNKLPAAVSAGIWDTIRLFTEKPPKGSKNNFGFAGYQNWIKLLTKPKQRRSWEKEFPRGRALYSGLTSLFERTATFGQATSGAERARYADFLQEASVILDKPALNDIAPLFCRSAEAWDKLVKIALPDDVPLLGETRRLHAERRDLFIGQGNASQARRKEINARLAEMKGEAEQDFPLSQSEVETLRSNLAGQVQTIHNIEHEAITALQIAMS